MPTCNVCHSSNPDVRALYCSKCGRSYPQEEMLPWVGQSKTRGRYRVTFAPQEGEFSNEDAVLDAIRHSVWNEDHTFEGKAMIEFIHSTVTMETHPYECVDCKSGGKNAMVSPTTRGRCECCGNVNWQPRTS